MYEGLKPCPHRRADDLGRILCGLLKEGDREVSVNLCRACPVPQINCQHLRAAVQKKVSTPITVRYATGRVEVWDDEPPRIGFKQAACAAKTMPIHSPRDCAGCPLRVPQVIPQNAVQIARQQPRAAPPLPIIQELPVQPLPEASAAQELVQRAQAVAARKLREPGGGAPGRMAERKPAPEAARPAAARKPDAARTESRSKIILLQQWLADQFDKKHNAPEPAPPPDPDQVQEIVYQPVAPVYQEEPGTERCVGWTD